MSTRSARLLFRAVGGIAVLCALFGLLYNAASFYAVAFGPNDDVVIGTPVPYVRPAFFLMSSVYVLLYAALLWCGVQFLRLSTGLWLVFVTVLAIEVIYYFVVGALWQHPTYGPSVAAATGVSGGGFLPQLSMLFPLWAPIAVWFARKALAGS
jgi:hypothetical protein